LNGRFAAIFEPWGGANILSPVSYAVDGVEWWNMMFCFAWCLNKIVPNVSNAMQIVMFNKYSVRQERFSWTRITPTFTKHQASQNKKGQAKAHPFPVILRLITFDQASI